MLLATNPLVKVIPGLMIWTIIAFAITLLRAEALRLRPDPEADRRAARPDPRSRSRRPTAPARRRARLLEEHRRLIGQAQERGRGDPRRGAQDRRLAARADARRDRGGPRSAASRRPSARSSRRRSRRSARSAREVGEPLADRGREDHAQVADRRRPAAPDRRGARRDRLLAAGGEPLIAAAHRIYARALFEAAAGQGPARRGARPSSPTSRARSTRCPSSTRCSTNPETDSRVKADVLEQRPRRAPTSSSRNFVARCVVEKGRAGEIREIAEEFEALVAAQAERPRRRADDRERALRRASSSASSADIEKALRPQGAGDAQRRSRPDRRHRPPGRLDAPRRERARPPRPTPSTNSRTTRS